MNKTYRFTLTMDDGTSKQVDHMVENIHDAKSWCRDFATNGYSDVENGTVNHWPPNRIVFIKAFAV